MDTTEERLPPTLVIQVWDNDSFSPDDFLGGLEFISTVGLGYSPDDTLIIRVPLITNLRFP